MFNPTSIYNMKKIRLLNEDLTIKIEKQDKTIVELNYEKKKFISIIIIVCLYAFIKTN